MRGWIVLYWDLMFKSLEWKFYNKEQELIEFLMGRNDEYGNIRDIWECKDLKNVKMKYMEMLKNRPGFNGIIYGGPT